MSEFENSPETAPESPTTEAHTPTLEDLLKEPERAEGEAAERPEKAEPTKGEKPKSLKDWAERFGLEAKDLYAVEVAVSEGQDSKPVTLGELKDAYGKQDELTRRELEFEERKVRQEADWTRSQNELRALIQALPPKAISEQALQLVRQQAEKELRVEREATMRAIPEWSDETRREAELQGMVAMLGDYGFPPSFLASQLNHKLIRFVRDSYLRKVRVEQALAKVQEVKRPSTTGKSSPAGTAKKPSGQPKNRSSNTPESRLMALLND
jgi:hypothetical protein